MAQQNNNSTTVSDLTEDLLDDIISRLSFRDAVRTSSVSKAWRRHWTRLNEVVFDTQFVTLVCDNLEPAERKTRYLKSIETILNLRRRYGRLQNGDVAQIQKFVLSVPARFPKSEDENVLNEWLRAASDRRMKHLTIVSIPSPARIEPPSEVFSGLGIDFLQLDYCHIRSLPADFQGFRNVTTLVLNSPWISPMAFATLVSGCAQLDTLSVTSYRRKVVISAPMLRTLSLLDCYIPVLDLRSAPNLATVSLENKIPKQRGMIEFFGSIPRAENITYIFSMVQAQPGQAIPMRLPVMLKCLRILTLTQLDLYSLDHLSQTLCIFRSSPNLETLNLSIRDTEGVDPAEDRLKALLSDEDSSTNRRLSAVKIDGLIGVAVERTLIRRIISHSPTLVSLHLDAGPKMSDAARQDMMHELDQVLQRLSKPVKDVVKWSSPMMLV